MNAVPLVRDVMQESKLSVRPGMDAFEALDLVIAKKLAGVPVIDEKGRLVGFLTEKDCLRLQVNSSQESNMTGRTVADIMSGINATLQPMNDILTAAMSFLRCNFATLPVVDGENLVGSITRRDMVTTIQRWHRERGHGFENEKYMQHIVQNASSIEELQNLVSVSNKEQLASMFAGRHTPPK
jgi:predicted transcriptional regulator